MKPSGRLQLFCFAHAGAAGTVFSGFGEHLGDAIEVCAVTIPGRGARIDEPFAESWPALIADLVQSVRGATRGPIALLGHSLGATVAFEVARALTAAGRPPVRVFLSAPLVLGEDAPDIDEIPVSVQQVLAMIEELAGERIQDIVDEPEILAFFSDIIRADFVLAAAYRFDGGAPLPVPATILLGEGDRGETPELIATWIHRLSAEVEIRRFAGGHLFLFNESPADALGLVKHRLADHVARNTSTGVSR